LGTTLQGYNAIGVGLVAAIGENLRSGNIGNALPYIKALEQLTVAYSNITSQLVALPVSSPAISTLISTSNDQLNGYAKQLRALATQIPAQFASAANGVMNG